MKRHAAVCFFLTLFALGASVAEGAKVMVILSRSLAPYEEAYDGIASDGKLDLVKLNMEGDPAKGKSLLAGAQAQGANLLITIGSEATLAARGSSGGLPVVYTMVLEKQDFGNIPAAGVLMQVDVSTQLKALKLLLPGKNRIGLLYHVRNAGDTVMLARQTAESQGRMLMPIAVVDQKAIPDALGKLTKTEIDLLWMIMDPVVAQPEAVRLLIQHSQKEKIPLVALSKFHVKAGAFAAFSVDYRDLGLQTAAVAQTMLKNQKPQAPEMPRRLLLHVNADMQAKLGIGGLPAVPGIQILSE